MPAWLITLLLKILQPLVESIIAKLELNARLNALEKNQNATLDAFQKLAVAKEPKDYVQAASILADSWNRP